MVAPPTVSSLSWSSALRSVLEGCATYCRYCCRRLVVGFKPGGGRYYARAALSEAGADDDDDDDGSCVDGDDYYCAPAEEDADAVVVSDGYLCVENDDKGAEVGSDLEAGLSSTEVSLSSTEGDDVEEERWRETRDQQQQAATLYAPPAKPTRAAEQVSPRKTTTATPAVPVAATASQQPTVTPSPRCRYSPPKQQQQHHRWQLLGKVYAALENDAAEYSGDRDGNRGEAVALVRSATTPPTAIAPENEESDRWLRTKEMGFKDPGLEEHRKRCLEQRSKLRSVADPDRRRRERLKLLQQKNAGAKKSAMMGLSPDDLQHLRRNLRKTSSPPPSVLGVMTISMVLFLTISSGSIYGVTAVRATNASFSPCCDDTSTCCRTNNTHVAWREYEEGHDRPLTTMPSRRRDLQQAACSSSCFWETWEEAQKSSYRYLRAHIMQFDLPFLTTLGFREDESAELLPDGLDGGLIGPTIKCALKTKLLYNYTDALPLSVWREYVLNYANANEARSNWRPLLFDRLSPLVDLFNLTDIASVVYALNKHMWTILSPNRPNAKGEVRPIVFVSSQTPLIFDPMSILVYGHASCTGLAILFINALRSLGVPARLAGTPAWHQQRSQGNHNWVEVWRDGRWFFLEPTAILDPQIVDSLDRDPCERWFCSRERFHYDDGNRNSSKLTTRVSVARLDSDDTSSFYRLAWEWLNQDVPGDDVTEYYQRICSKCQ